jgi:hypothetical protein
VEAPRAALEPVVHPQDAASNPAFALIHTFHVGSRFNSPADAVKAGCPGTVTPFNGEHTAGVQAVSTRNFAEARGWRRPVRGGSGWHEEVVGG